MAEKIYCGNAKIRTTQFGDVTQLSLSTDDINKIVGHMKSEKLTWVNINVKEKREPVQGKPTHYLEVDTWKPDPNYKQDDGVKLNSQEAEGDALPF